MLEPNLQIKHRYIRMETVGSSQLEHATYSRYQKFVEKERMNYNSVFTCYKINAKNQIIVF